MKLSSCCLGYHFDVKPLISVDLGWQLVLEYAGPTSEVRIERISRDCFRDGGALAEVMAFYKAKGENDAALSVKVEENVDPGLEVGLQFFPPP
jgi:hypothetical protein